MTFSEVKTVYQMIIGGKFNFIEAFPSLVEFIAVMLLTIVMGRWFCGWLCAFGAYNDLIYFISRKVFKVKFKVNEIEYKCSMLNNEDRFILIKKNEEPPFYFDTWNEWKDKSLKIINNRTRFLLLHLLGL